MAIRTSVRFGIGIVLLPLLIHRLGTEATGLFLFATTLTGYFTAIEYSLATSLTKYVAEHRATGDATALNSATRGNLLLMTGVGLALGVGLAAFGLFAGQSLFHEAAIREQAVPAIGVAAAGTLLYWPSRVGPAALEGLERYDLSAALSLCASIATIGGVFVLTSFTRSVTALVALAIGILIVQNVAAGALAWPHLGIRRGAGKWVGTHLRPLLTFGGALFVIGIADTLNYAFDRAIVAGFVGAAAIVVYEVAVRIQSAVRTLSSLAGGALLSTTARLAAQQRIERMRELVLVGSFLGVVFTTPIAVATIVLAKPLIVLWVGAGFAHYAWYAQIFVSFWIVHSNTSVLGSVVTGVGRLGIFAAIAIAGSIVGLALSVVLTWQFGTIGVILGTVIPAWVGLPIWMVIALRRVHVGVAEYARTVIVPAYSILALWAPLLVLLDLVVRPRGFVVTAAVGVGSVGAYWLATFRLATARWRRVTGTASVVAG